MSLSDQQEKKIESEIKEKGFPKVIQNLVKNVTKFSAKPAQVELFAKIIEFASKRYYQETSKKIKLLEKGALDSTSAPDIDSLLEGEGESEPVLIKKIECPYCREQISKTSKQCPYCNSGLSTHGSQLYENNVAPKYLSMSLTSIDLRYLLFSFEGRINRKLYLEACAALSLVVIPILIIGNRILPFDASGTFGLGSLLIIPTYYVSLAVSVKRLHDRGRSGFFTLLFLVPFLGLWPAFEMLFLKGSEGTNSFGNDPLTPAPKQ